MSLNDLLLVVLVAAGAFYAGYQVGRLKALAERGQSPSAGAQPPLSGPLDGGFDEASSVPSSQRSSRPPVTAGNDHEWSQRSPPRRSSKPPPASAGLMGTGAAEKPDTRQK